MIKYIQKTSDTREEHTYDYLIHFLVQEQKNEQKKITSKRKNLEKL